jgi:hypothetical protein
MRGAHDAAGGLGPGLPAPLFADSFEVLSQRILKDKHLKLKLRKGAQRFDAIQFNFAESAPGTASTPLSASTSTNGTAPRRCNCCWSTSRRPESTDSLPASSFVGTV